MCHTTLKIHLIVRHEKKEKEIYYQFTQKVYGAIFRFHYTNLMKERHFNSYDINN